jgi:hypothetical protein
MMFRHEDGCYLFQYRTEADRPCDADLFFSSLEEAASYCDDVYSVPESAWTNIEEPLDGCQQDLIAPVRVKGRNQGNPQWGSYEILENDIWKDIDYLQ